MNLSNVTWPPRQRAEIQRIQSDRKRIAFERARQSPFYRGRLDGIDARRLDDPEVWRKIPVLSKEELRNILPEDFHAAFCIRPDTDAVEYWRSGGSTGRPLFYPRSAEDMGIALDSWKRLWLAPNCNASDKAHISFPMGIHPVGQLYARAAELLGIGTIWAGAGSNTSSEMQVELIHTLKPTVWAGMASYGLQLASIAEKMGIDLSKGSVRKILCAAEPLSKPKRDKLERLWNAEVYDQFGCTENSAFGSESECHDGLHMFTDMTHVEVVDPDSGDPLPYGQSGLMVITPLFTNTMTPFLRWNMGDIGFLEESGATTGPMAPFPVFRHSARTSGFFKVRGVNINHTDFEDFIHRIDAVTDFRLEVADGSTNDELRLQVEFRRDASRQDVGAKLAADIKRIFEVTPVVQYLEVGTLAQMFLTDIKAKRFVDSRAV